MRTWMLLTKLEYEWRVIRIYRKVINWLIKKRMKLSSPILCNINKIMGKHSIALIETKRLYEKTTGKIIVYYNYDKI